MTLAKIVLRKHDEGNTEEIADIVAEALENLAIEVDINECTQSSADEFEEADIFALYPLIPMVMVNCQTRSLISMKTCKN